MEYILEVENLSFTYPDKNKALDKVNFKIEKGSKVFFQGANGSGKTTLFQCINGLLPAKQGKIIIEGKTCKERERLNKIAIVFQNANDQIIAGSVFDEVAFGPLNMGLSTDEVIARAENALSIMNISGLRDKPPHFLSYGQKKSVSIASVLSMNRNIIILDEPTAGLDTKQTEELINILGNLSDTGHTLLISTHDQDFSYRLADKVIVLDNGEIAAEGNAADVFSNDEVLVRTGLMKPVVMEIYEALGYKTAEDKMPRDRRQLLKIIESGRKL